MAVEFNLDAYLERIGFRGECTPSLETLAAIHLLHAETIPFENLDPFLRCPVRLDPEALQQKLVQSGRGGYCFEQNLLLSHALDALGFHVKGLAARVLWNLAEDDVPHRGHMLLLVSVNDNPYVVDVGFGGLTLTGPLRLEPNIEQATPHESFRLQKLHDEFILQAKISDTWKSLYRFDLQERFLWQHKLTNRYLSSSPNSKLVTDLMAARPDRNRRYALHNNNFAVHHVCGSTERCQLATTAELRATLEGAFRLTLTTVPGLDAALDRLITGSDPTATASLR